jgi:hypothetical protein
MFDKLPDPIGIVPVFKPISLRQHMDIQGFLSNVYSDKNFFVHV